MKQKFCFFLLLVLTQLNVFSQSGTHLNFDGVNDYINIPNSSTFQFGTNHLTIEAMVKMSDSQIAYAGIFAKLPTSVKPKGIQFVIVGNKIAVEYGGFNLINMAGTTLLNDDQWHHVACVLNRTDKTLKLYVDGVMEANTYSEQLGIDNISNSNSVYVGLDRTGAAKYKGNIDEIRVWNVPRTPEQLNGSTNCELLGTETGLLAYYKFNQGNGGQNNTSISILNGATTTPNNGTLMNFAKTGTASNWLSGSAVVTGSIIPSVPTVTATSITYVQGESSSPLAATVGANGTGLLWYTSASSISGTPALIPSTLYAGVTSYWVASTNAYGCEGPRAEVQVTVTALPVPTALNPQVYAGSGTIADLTATLSNLRWYTSTTGGTALLSTTVLVDGATYHVAHSSGEAESIRTAVKVRKISAASQLFCNSATIANFVTTPSPSATAKWYDVATGGTALLETTLVTTGNYYVEQTETETSNRVLVPITVEEVSMPTNPPTIVHYYKGATATALTATIGTNGTSLLWYTVASGGTGTATAPVPSTATTGYTSYWVSSKNDNGCESARTEVVVLVTILSAPSAKNPQVYSGTATVANLTAFGGNLLWYAANEGGTALLSTAVLVDGTTYYVATTYGNVESSRTAVKVRKISAASQLLCSGATIASLVTTPSPSATAKWYYYATGGLSLSGTTQLITWNYYVEQQGTETSNRVLVPVTVEAVAVPIVAPLLSYSKDAVASPLTATSSATGLLWYTVASGGTGSTTAPIPSTTTFGSTTYWVSSTNANGCEGPRVAIQVKIVGPATNLNFDGVNDYVSIPTIIATGSSYTKEAMIKPNAITGVYNIISAEGSAFWIHNGYIKAGHTTALSDVFAAASSLLSSWNHVAVTYDAPSTTMKLYVNGVMVSQNASVPSSTGNSIQIGAYTATSVFDGGMDEVRIWNKVLTGSEINRRKNCELQGSESGLIAYYKFNQGNANLDNPTQTSLTNSALSGTAGTLINFELNNVISNFSVGSTVTTGIAVPLSPTVTTPVNYVQGATPTSLTATGSGLLWYSVATGGTSSATALTPSAANAGTTSYWVSSSNANGCESDRAEIKVIVVAPAPPTAKSPQIYAGTGTIANLNAIGNNIKWYSTPTPGTALELTTPLVDGTTYYVSQFSGVVESATTPVTVRRISESSQTVCSGATLATLAATPSAGATEKWFNVATGGTQLLGTTVLTTGNYYVEQLGIETSNRILITVVLEYSQVPTITTPVTYSSGAVTIPLTAASGEVGLLWYTVASGGVGTATAPTPNSTVLGNTSYWVSSTKANGCESPRVEMVVRVEGPATNLNFDGIDDFVTIGSIIAPAASYTKEAMIKPNAVTGSYNILSSAGDVFWITNFGIRAGHANNFSLVSASAVPLFNTWNHVAVTYDAPSTTMKLYVNGVMVSENTTVPASAGNTIQLGAYANAVLFNGGMDEVRIWNKALTADEINRRKNCELQGSESGLLAYYKFNQGQANLSNAGLTSLTDSSPNSKTGTLSGFALNNSTSNFSVGSPITTGVAVPSVPTVATPVIYDAGSTASPLTTNSGTGLLWYTVASGGTSSETAITPATTTVGNTSYWVSSSNANGCESERAEIVVTIDAVQVTITTQPSNSTLIGGTNADFAVVADGTVLDYQWQVSYDDGSTFSDISNEGLFSGATTANLAISTVPISMSGTQYRAKINGSAVISNPAALTVTVPAFDNTRVWNTTGAAGFSAGASDQTVLFSDNNGMPYVAFNDHANANKVTVMKFNGTAWINVGSAGFSEVSNVFNLNLAFDTSNTPYIGYVGGVAGSTVVQVKKFTGTTWENVGGTALTYQGEELTLAIDGLNQPFIAYSDANAANKMTVRKFNGTAWTLVGTAGFTAMEAYDASLAIDFSGTPYVFYRDENEGKPAVMKYDGSAWVPVGPASGFYNGVAFYNAIIIDRAGTPYVTFVDFSYDELMVMKFNGTEWVAVGNTNFAAGVINNYPTVLDASGTPFVVYQDSNNDYKATVKRFDGTAWTTVGTAGFSSSTADYSSITMDSEGTPYVVFVDASVANKTTVMKFTEDPAFLTTWINQIWDNGVPNLTMKAVIKDALTLTTDLDVKELIVTQLGSIVVASGTTLTVDEKITNHGAAAHFLVENNGTLLQNTASTNIGTGVVKRNSAELFRQDYSLWSSPVGGQNLRAFSLQTLYNRFSSYDAAVGTNGDYVQEIFTTNDMNTKLFSLAKGYLIRVPNNWVTWDNIDGDDAQSYEGTFAGTLTNGDVNVALSGANSKLNLVGNPYPSRISIADFFAANSDINETLYFWRKKASASYSGVSPSGYATYTPLMGLTSPDASIVGSPTHIETGQGFFVVANSATPGNLTFTNSMRTNGTATFYRGATDTTNELHRMWLNLSTANVVVGQTLIGYATGASQGIDNGYDAAYLNDSPMALTSLINGVEYAIQGLGVPFDHTSSVALGFKTNAATTYSISLANFDGLFIGNQNIYIKDNLTGLVHNVKESAYSFTANEGIANDRFEVVYQNSTLGTNNPDIDINKVMVYKEGQDIVINAITMELEKVELYDIRGSLIQVLENVNATTATFSKLNIANQVVLVKITAVDNQVTTKKIVF
ncbi:LamG-like jellyroll fold domain-containing protein [Flavobacterium sp. SM2513]|uniref:Ig-like domain-containing protein n=1 Tax=Flavobacterium sp. SM2513 TaxID=3424766 RepID=UPI003D7FB643